MTSDCHFLFDWGWDHWKPFEEIVLVKGRDEKSCKMDVDGHRHVDERWTSTVDRMEKSSLVDVDQEKSSVMTLTIEGRRWQNKKIYTPLEWCESRWLLKNLCLITTLRLDPYLPTLVLFTWSLNKVLTKLCLYIQTKQAKRGFAGMNFVVYCDQD